MTDQTTWNFDEDLGGTFAMDKAAMGLKSNEPLPADDDGAPTDDN